MSTIPRHTHVTLRRPHRVDEDTYIALGTIGVVVFVNLDGSEADVDFTLHVHRPGYGFSHYHHRATVPVEDLEVLS